MTPFARIQAQTGTSNNGLARLFDVRVDTIKNWKYGRCTPPDKVMAQMEAYAEAAAKIFNQEQHYEPTT